MSTPNIEACPYCNHRLTVGLTICPKCGADIPAIFTLPASSRARSTEVMRLDVHGQPVGNYNTAQRRTREVAEMLGLAKGIIADGVVNDAEVTFLREWAHGHQEAITQWPASLIFSRLEQIIADGRIDEHERIELYELLASLVGGTETVALGFDMPSTFPLDTPAPLMLFENEVYVFTGRFAYGTRRHCEAEIVARGGAVSENVTQSTSFLVIGTFSSRDWITSAYGRKIQHAAKLRDSGFPLRIVGEDHWARAL